jgi:hypothetical protein
VVVAKSFDKIDQHVELGNDVADRYSLRRDGCPASFHELVDLGWKPASLKMQSIAIKDLSSDIKYKQMRK